MFTDLYRNTPDEVKETDEVREDEVKDLDEIKDTVPEQTEELKREPIRTDGKAKIKVIGVGGAGNNAVNRMIEAGIRSAEYIAVNTDAQILACSKTANRIQIGTSLTEDADLLFITAGMGGGTGTGAAPVIAKLARERRILTVAVVTEPFSFEGKRRMDNARRGIDEIRKYVDTIVIIPNDKILQIDPKVSVPEALRVADDVLKQGIRGIADIIVTPSIINLDFADVKTILKDKGLAHMGVGVAKGENRIVNAVRLAVNSPLLETTIEGATAVLINITGGNDITIDEMQTAGSLIQSVVDYSANIIFGTCIDENMQDEVQVTIIATGFQSEMRNFSEPVQREAAEPVRMQPQAEAYPAAPAPAPEPVPTPAPMPAPTPVAAPMPAPVQEPVQPIFNTPAPTAEAEKPTEKPDNGPSDVPVFLRHLFGKKKS